ncbi:MAG: guanylate kinase [Alphaproteobacteria bacterium]|nr:guanylate kinase [Alphaproteobacteria bacterium]
MQDEHLKRRGLMLVLSSPSGAGKTTISRRLLEIEDDLTMSVSATTRRKRPGETEGKDYYFTDNQDFGERVNRGELLEHAKVFDYYYGTPRAPVEKALSAGRDVLFDIDWQGTQQIYEQAGDDLVRVFILPPSTRALEARLRARAQDTEEVVARRMSEASSEMSHWQEYDYVIVNDDLDKSLQQVRTILAAERLKRTRQIGLGEFVKLLRSGH